MDRTSFFNITTVNGNKEYDYLYNNLSRFVMSYPVGHYQIMAQDVMRPDLISYKIYGTVDYWWILLYVNGIDDPLTGIVDGTIITTPNILDIYQFYKQYALR